ncbi:MAG: hypothetical protein ACLP1X_18630 [Polyangiaceae bacterium]
MTAPAPNRQRGPAIKVTGIVLSKIADRSSPTLGELWLCEFAAQTVESADGQSVSIMGMTRRAMISRKMEERGIEVCEGDKVIALVSPNDSGRIARILFNKSTP